MRSPGCRRRTQLGAVIGRARQCLASLLRSRWRSGENVPDDCTVIVVERTRSPGEIEMEIVPV